MLLCYNINGSRPNILEPVTIFPKQDQVTRPWKEEGRNNVEREIVSTFCYFVSRFRLPIWLGSSGEHSCTEGYLWETFIFEYNTFNSFVYLLFSFVSINSVLLQLWLQHIVYSLS